MTSFKRFLGIALVLALGVVIFNIIGRKSQKNRGFDDKLSWTSHTEKLKTIESTMKSLSEEIKKKTGDGSCDYDHECHVAGLGVKTCDGYLNFLVYSTKGITEFELLTLVEDFNKASEEFNELSLNVANCGNPPKEAHCLNKRCTVATP